jgi:hypothetical protein
MIYIQYPDFGIFAYMSYVYLDILNSKYDCKIFYSNQKINFKNEDLVIMILNWSESVINNCTFEKDTKIIVFNLDTYKNHPNQWNYCRNLNKISQNLTLLEYNPINQEYFNLNNKCKNVNSIYFPFGYNNYYPKIFKNIKSVEKDIDVLFYGCLNIDRRKNINLELSKFCNSVFIETFESYEKQYEYINRSKIVLDIYFYPDMKVFDYYRLSNLISNDVFVIIETPEFINLEIEPNLKDYDKYLVCAKYDNMVETVKKYLAISEEERKNIAIKAKEWFKENTNFEKNLLNLVSSILT